MIGDIERLREPLLAARLLREETLAMPLLPRAAERVRAERREWNRRPPASGPAIDVAARIGSGEGFLDVTDGALGELAAAAGARALRAGPGVRFQGRDAPLPSAVPALYAELLATVNGAHAVEVWSPITRAFVLHFLLRLVQPFEGMAAAIGHAAEALVLASDGFDARAVGLPGPAPDDGVAMERPDPAAFVLSRTHALVESLGVGRDRQRAAAAIELLLEWAERPGSAWNDRQRRFARWALDSSASFDFQEYVRFHSGRRGTGLRTLQRDWRALRQAGWIDEVRPGVHGFSTEPLTWERQAPPVSA